ncbi:MAG: DUF433 domain-containing protein [Planctomycetes bacterium]|nr:DUF433 domain-containing protein [Planctomycetota bacterium]
MKTETIEIVDRGRGPQLSTTRITVMDIFYWFHRGYSWEDILKEMPSLSRAELDVVIAYIDAHHDELVERDQRVEEIIEQRIAEQHARPGFGPPDPNVPREERMARLREKLHNRIAEKNGEGHPD